MQTMTLGTLKNLCLSSCAQVGRSAGSLRRHCPTMSCRSCACSHGSAVQSWSLERELPPCMPCGMVALSCTALSRAPQLMAAHALLL